MYKECLTCNKLGVSCDGPNFIGMSARELSEWCRLRKTGMGLTNAKLSELSSVPKGTIDRLLSGDVIDFKFETIRPLLKTLVGGSFDGNPCPAPDDNNAEHLEEIIAQQKESIRLLEDEKNEMLEFFTGQAKRRIRWIITLAVMLFFTLFVIIVALVIDRIDPDVGFFWTAFNWSTRLPKFNIGI